MLLSVSGGGTRECSALAAARHAAAAGSIRPPCHGRMQPSLNQSILVVGIVCRAPTEEEEKWRQEVPWPRDGWNSLFDHGRFLLAVGGPLETFYVTTTTTTQMPTTSEDDWVEALHT